MKEFKWNYHNIILNWIKTTKKLIELKYEINLLNIIMAANFKNQILTNFLFFKINFPLMIINRFLMNFI